MSHNLSSPDFWYMQIHPDDRERVLANNFGDYGDDKAPPIEYRVLRRGGSVWCEGRKGQESGDKTDGASKG